MNPKSLKASPKSEIIILVVVCIFLGLITQQKFNENDATDYVEMFLQYNDNKLPQTSINAYTFANSDTEKHEVATWEVVKTRATGHSYSILIDATFDDGETKKIQFVGEGAGTFLRREIGFVSPPQINVLEK